MKKQYVYGYKETDGKSNIGKKSAMLILCGVCALAALITFGTVSFIQGFDEKQSSNVNDNEVVIQNKEVVTELSDDNGIIEEDEEIAIVQSDISTEQAAEINLQSENKAHTFTAPCQGNIILEFSPAIPVYSRTLDDWRTHMGVDIGAPLGREVQAIADGTIIDVYEDLRFGTTVKTEHSNGIIAIYSNLDNNGLPSEGCNVKKGDVIARVGDTALFETVADTHLHFELIKDGVNVNPMDYFSLE